MNSKHYFKMKNIIINGLFIVLVCSMSMRLSKASPDDDNYEDEYHYDEDYDYNDSSESSRSQDYDVTTEIAKVTKVNVSDVESPPIVEENHEDKTESVHSVLIAETEIHQDDPCPKSCTCDEQLQFIDCSNQSLSEIPKNLPNSSLRVDLGNNEITEIQDSDLSNLTVVRQIILKNNKIQNINESVFEALERLDSIDLSSNNISKIDPDLFVHAKGLSQLTLNDNPIAFEANKPFLNVPDLEILDLVGCNITELYNETFRNLAGLKSLNLANNSFVEDINVHAFNPLSYLLKLKIPHVSKAATYELCDKITVIDVISFDNYNISCYELISGSTYDESTITHGPTLHLENTTMPMRSASTSTQASIKVVTEATTKSPSINIPEITETTPKINESIEYIDALNTTNSEDDVESKEVDKSTQSIKTILIASIAIAVFGLVIGLICRKDVFGVKTKLCRTQRPEPPTIPEQVPLNKV